jgi:hypothetical protein
VQNAELLNVKADDTYNYHSALNLRNSELVVGGPGMSDIRKDLHRYVMKNSVIE